MCIEERRLIFSNAELIEALRLFCEQSGRKFGFDRQADLSFSNSSALSVELTDRAGVEKPILFHETEIAVALILLAKALKIPIAKRAEKTLEIAPDKIIFVMTLAAA